MKIKGIETELSGVQLINALLSGGFGYNPVCKCGKKQTKDGCKQMLKLAKAKNADIDHDYICHSCQNSRECIVFGKTYPSVKAAAEATYNPEICRCKDCGKVFSKNQWYQWCQRYLDQNDGDIICHSCLSSKIRLELNDRDHEQLSQATTERNLKNWQDPEYIKQRSLQQSEIAKRMWADPEERFGEHGDLTYAQYKSLKPKNALTSKDDPYWELPNYWQNILIGRTPFKLLDMNPVDRCRAFIDTVNKLYDKYKLIYAEPSLSTDTEKTWYKGAEELLKKYEIHYDTYLNFLTQYSTRRGNHHVLLRSIEEIDSYMVALEPAEHVMAHFLLVLDNFCSENAPNLVNEVGMFPIKTQMQIFMGLARIGYVNIQRVHNKTWLADILSILKVQNI